MGMNVFILDYRGYGKSEGVPGEPGLVYDALAGLDFLVSHPAIDPEQIIVFGRSLGAAVAIQLARLRVLSTESFIRVCLFTYHCFPFALVLA